MVDRARNTAEVLIGATASYMPNQELNCELE